MASLPSDGVYGASLVIVPLASKDVYLDRYARPGQGLDRQG